MTPHAAADVSNGIEHKRNATLYFSESEEITVLIPPKEFFIHGLNAFTIKLPKEKRRKMMFELLIVFAFVWLSLKTVGLAFRLTWGAAKIVAALLLVLACPALIIGLLFAGGLVLLLPVLMVCAAFSIVRNC